MAAATVNKLKLININRAANCVSDNTVWTVHWPGLARTSPVSRIWIWDHHTSYRSASWSTNSTLIDRQSFIYYPLYLSSARQTTVERWKFQRCEKKTVSNRTALPQLVDENLSTAEDKKLPLVPTNPCDCVCLCDCVCKCENIKVWPGRARASHNWTWQIEKLEQFATCH